MNYDCSSHGLPKRQRLESYLDRLFGYAFSLTKDRERAQDLVQICALKSLSAERVPVDEPAYRAWLFKILRNAFHDEVRKKSAAEIVVDELDGDGEFNRNNSQGLDVSSVEQKLINTLAVRKALLKIRLEYREILVLVDLAGFSYKETACLLGIPAGTVMSRLSRARKALLDELSRRQSRRLPLRIVRSRK